MRATPSKGSMGIIAPRTWWGWPKLYRTKLGSAIPPVARAGQWRLGTKALKLPWPPCYPIDSGGRILYWRPTDASRGDAIID